MTQQMQLGNGFRFVLQREMDKTKFLHAFRRILIFRHSELEASIFDDRKARTLSLRLLSL